MKEHRSRLANAFEPNQIQEKSFFALLCAERLRGCCWAAQAATGDDHSYFFQWVDRLFKCFVEREHLTQDELLEGLEQVESIVPEGGEPLAVQVQSGVLCLLTSLELLDNRSDNGVVEASNFIVDALDNYVFSTRRRITGDMTSPKDYILLQREVARQNEDVEFAKNLFERSASEVIAYRLENCEFAVPIAV